MMIQQWWSRSSDDPDPVQWCWSRLRDDPDLVMMFHVDPDREMIQIQWWCSMLIQIERWSRSSEDDLKTKMNWRRRWLEDEDDLNTRWSSWYREEDQCWKLCRKNTFLVKRECWCICNFRMYSSMYLMYCNPMFIPGRFYYVFESCGHAPMFRSGGLIM